MSPKLPPLPRLPKLPKPSELLPKSNPVRRVFEDARGIVRTGQEEIRNLASAINPASPSATSPTTASQVSETSKVSDAETLQYQLDHLLDELNLIETHLSEGCHIAGKPCDCCEKSGRRIKAYATETVSIAARQGVETEIFSELASWASEVQEIGTEEAVRSGKYKERYAIESGTASTLRKKVQKIRAGCKPCAELDKLRREFERRE